MDKILDFLASVERPSRYLGSEVNTVRKDPDRIRLRFALAFPDLYEIGTSHFGIQILYSVLNNLPEVAAERVFAPAADLEERLRRTGAPLFSLETHTPLGRFDIVGFSLLYELNYTNVLTMLELAGIPWSADARDLTHPFVIAGGPCTCNPEPMAEFFDAMIVGDGETVAVELARTWLEWKAAGGRDRKALLRRWSEIDGVYIPGFFEARYDAAGFQTLVPQYGDYAGVRRAVVGDLEAQPFPCAPVLSFGKPIHDRLRLEVSRGCTRGCRFCQAGMIYRPVRERAPRSLIKLAEKSLAATGYEDLSLLSLSTGDYLCIAPLVQQLMAHFASKRVAVSLPSLRAGTLTPDLMEMIKQVRKTGFTIAPEAGSQRLRDVINKNIGEADIFNTVRDAFQLGWNLIKLYFMIGLPTETPQDLQELVELAHRLRRTKTAGKARGQINVSLATFIPKPHTPFQWAGQISLAESRERLRFVEERLSVAGIQFKWQNPQMSLLEGVFARGDRRLGRVLRCAHRRGCRFDGWSDRFDFAAWKEAFAEAQVDPDFYTTRTRSVGEPLPWAHIDVRVDPDFLAAEWRRALTGGVTADCRRGECHGCGVCDFDEVRPRVYPAFTVEPYAGDPQSPTRPAAHRRVGICYEKTGPARFFGHLELVNIFLRALRRAEIPVAYSEGFHPKPKVAFDNPLPTGMESEEERMSLAVAGDLQPEALAARLNAELPAGLRAFVCAPGAAAAGTACIYRVDFPEPAPELDPLQTERIDPDQVLTVVSGKGKLKNFELKDILFHIERIDSRRVELTMACEPGRAVRPAEILKQVFRIPENRLTGVRIRKLKPPSSGPS
jgi:radical SAM family uncharacterized protein/radical SAM-linked protein